MSKRACVRVREIAAAADDAAPGPADGEAEGLLVFVSGPYSAETRLNRRTNTMSAVDAGIILLKAGHFPYVPHLSHFVHERALDHGTEVEYEEWMSLALAWLCECDGLLYLASSPGADRERRVAEELGLPVWDDVEDVPGVSRMWVSRARADEDGGWLA